MHDLSTEDIDRYRQMTDENEKDEESFRFQE
jgi:hypothetical protein